VSTTDQASTAEEVSSLIGDAVERMAAVSEEMDDVSPPTPNTRRNLSTRYPM